MQISDAGILPYRSDRGFELSFPNKVGEYLSEGLPIISSIDGVLSKFLEKEGIGLTYRNGDLEGLVNSIYTIIDNKDLKSDMQKKAKIVFNKKFNLSTKFLLAKNCSSKACANGTGVSKLAHLITGASKNSKQFSLINEDNSPPIPPVAPVIITTWFSNFRFISSHF